MRPTKALLAVVIGAAAIAVAGPHIGAPWGSVTDGARSLFGRIFSTTPERQAGAPTAKGGPAPVVTVSQPVERQVTEWDEYTGRFDAVETVEVRARISGYLTEVRFKDGQEVKEGDLLFVIDQRPFERALELAQAELDQARVRVQNSVLDVDRGRPLLERKVISEKVFDDRENILRDAQSAVKVAEARVRSAELELSFTRITAPVSGRISRTFITAGNFIGIGGAPLTTIVKQDPIYIYFDVSENNAIKYKRLAESGATEGGATLGTRVGVGLPDEQGFPHEGRLDFLDNRLDVGTGTLRARAVLDNKARLFSPGMFARVRLQGAPRASALLLPDEAIGTDLANRYVYVVDDAGMPTRRTVKPGPMANGLRIIRGGITANDWVVVKGQQRVRPGQLVAAKRESIELSDAASGDTGTLPVKR